MPPEIVRRHARLRGVVGRDHPGAKCVHDDSQHVSDPSARSSSRNADRRSPRERKISALARVVFRPIDLFTVVFVGVWFGLNVYSLIHGDFVHLGANTIWLLPFGTAVARRFGPLRYLAGVAATATCASSFSWACGCSISTAGEQSVACQAHIGG